MAVKLSYIKRLCPGSPVQSFYAGSKIFQLPAAVGTNSHNNHDEAYSVPGHSNSSIKNHSTITVPQIPESVWNKVHDAGWINVWQKRRKMETGYQWGHWGGPAVNAMTAEEVASFFQTSEYWRRASYKRLLKSASAQARFLAMFATCLIVPVVPAMIYALYVQRWEPMEIHMPADDYFRHFHWHYYGPDIDHHAFVQYLEARRANKWRHSNHDVDLWIPTKFGGKQ